MPKRNRASSPRRWYIWHFSMQGLPPLPVTRQRRELLPHVFTLTTPKRGSNFLWHFLLTNKRHPAVNRCIALCCPDFPLQCSDSSVCSVVKIRRSKSQEGLESIYWQRLHSCAQPGRGQSFFLRAGSYWQKPSHVKSHAR